MVSVDIDDGRAIGEIVWGASFARSPDMDSAPKEARERERLEYVLDKSALYSHSWDPPQSVWTRLNRIHHLSV